MGKNRQVGPRYDGTCRQLVHVAGRNRNTRLRAGTMCRRANTSRSPRHHAPSIYQCDEYHRKDTARSKPSCRMHAGYGILTETDDGRCGRCVPGEVGSLSIISGVLQSSLENHA